MNPTHDHSVATTNGQHPNKLAAIQADIDEAERTVNAAKRADRRAGDNLAEKSTAKAAAERTKAETAATLRSARKALEALEAKLAEAQGSAS